MSEQNKFNKKIGVIYSFIDKRYYLCTSWIEDNQEISFLRKISIADAKDYIDVYELEEVRRGVHGIIYS